MPSEVVIPSIVAAFVLMLIVASAAGALAHSVIQLTASLEESLESAARARLGRVSIVRASLTNLTQLEGGGYSVELRLEVLNEGGPPIYDPARCDLLVQYAAAGGGLGAKRLAYGAEWTVELVILGEAYGVPFAEKPSIGSGEVGVIRALFEVSDLDASRPMRVIFVSQYGRADARWVSVGA